MEDKTPKVNVLLIKADFIKKISGLESKHHAISNCNIFTAEIHNAKIKKVI